MTEQNHDGGTHDQPADPDAPAQVHEPRQTGTRDEAQQKDPQQSAGEGPPGGQHDDPPGDRPVQNR